MYGIIVNYMKNGENIRSIRKVVTGAIELERKKKNWF